MTLHRYLIISTGAEPATAEPTLVTGDPRLVEAALAAIFGELQEQDERPAPTPLEVV